MLRYTLKRLIWLVIVLLGLCAGTFTISRVVPGDPAAAYLGPRPRPEQLAMAREQLGLDKPLYVQFVYYLRDLMQGNFGESLRTHRPVLTGILEHLPASLELMFSAIGIALLVGIPLGVISARYDIGLSLAPIGYRHCSFDRAESFERLDCHLNTLVALVYPTSKEPGRLSERNAVYRVGASCRGVSNANHVSPYFAQLPLTHHRPGYSGYGIYNPLLGLARLSGARNPAARA